MNIEMLLNEMGEKLGLSALPLDGNRCCAIVLDSQVHVELHHVDSADTLCLAADVGSPVEGVRGDLCRQLLHLNADPQRQGDGGFALEPETDRLTLCRSVDPNAHDSQSLLDLCCRWPRA